MNNASKYQTRDTARDIPQIPSERIRADKADRGEKSKRGAYRCAPASTLTRAIKCKGLM